MKTFILRSSVIFPSLDTTRFHLSGNSSMPMWVNVFGLWLGNKKAPQLLHFPEILSFFHRDGVVQVNVVWKNKIWKLKRMCHDGPWTFFSHDFQLMAQLLTPGLGCDSSTRSQQFQMYRILNAPSTDQAGLNGVSCSKPIGWSPALVWRTAFSSRFEPLMETFKGTAW